MSVQDETKVETQDQASPEGVATAEPEAKPKRRRGRPRKSETVAAAEAENKKADRLDDKVAEKSAAGRKRKEKQAEAEKPESNTEASEPGTDKVEKAEEEAAAPDTSRMRNRNKRNGNRRRREDEEPVSKEMEGVTLNLKEISAKSPTELLAMADSYGIENAAGMRKQEQVSAILRAHARMGGTIYSEGVLEILPDGFGFLRSSDANYLAGPDDVYVSSIRFANITCARVIP